MLRNQSYKINCFSHPLPGELTPDIVHIQSKSEVVEFEQEQHGISLQYISLYALQLCKIKKDSRDGVNQEFVFPNTLEKLFHTGSSQQSCYSSNARKVSLALALLLLKQ